VPCPVCCSDNKDCTCDETESQEIEDDDLAAEWDNQDMTRFD